LGSVETSRLVSKGGGVARIGRRLVRILGRMVRRVVGWQAGEVVV
jgi:hypothetical protein